jgi:long-chain acyl-CoA synthetase
MTQARFPTIRALIEHHAAERAASTYARATETSASITYGELAQSCRKVWALLQAHGVKAGDTVSVVMPNGLNTLRLLLGTMWGGACVNPVNLLAQPEQMRYVLEHSDCKLVVAAPEWAARVREMLSNVNREVGVIVADPDQLALPGENGNANPASADETRSPQTLAAGRAAGESVAASPTADQLALLMYTSGTTGVPKGVMLTQGNLAANALSISTEHALTPADRVLAVLPLYHINAFAVTMLAPLASGGSLAMAPRFSVARFWAQALHSQCTWLNVVPTIVSFLLEAEAPPQAQLEQLAHLRFLRSASAPLAPEHLSGFEQRFGVGVIETMGLTETVAPCFSNPLQRSHRKLGSVGRASGCEARVIDAALQEVPDGQTGEIAMRGPNVMRGYYKNEAATAASFTPDGWLRSGDLGHRDADGYFFVTGRIKELIIKGGENIAPREIDEVLLRHPAVLDGAAVGMPDKHYGQEIMACVVLREGVPCTEDELRAFCEQHLGRYKTPKLLRFVSELPRGPSGKVQRLKLLDTLAN